MRTDIDYITIEPSRFQADEFVAYGYGTYGPTSVLAGQVKRVYLESFTTIDEAIAAYPLADVSDSFGIVDNRMSDTPPSWFDPAYAGEEW